MLATRSGRAILRVLRFAPLGLLVFALSSCSGGAATTVEVRAGDFAFAVDKSTVPAGRVHFAFTNQSTSFPHELWVYPQSQPRVQEMVRLKESGQDVEEKDYLQGVV